MDTMEKVKSRAVEIGVYLPLGAYSKLKDKVTDIDSRSLKKMYGNFVDRGEERVKPVEKAVSGRIREMRKDTKRTATTASKKVKGRADEVASKTKATATKVKKRTTAAGSQVAPKMPRVAAPATAEKLAISDYDDLTVGEVTTRLNGLTQTDLARVYKYERANQNRSTILESIETKLLDLPIPSYDGLTVDEINGRLDGLTEQEIRALRKYEADTKARQTVLERMDSKLS